MLRRMTSFLLVVLVTTVCTHVSRAQAKKLPSVVILATGGTIAGAASTGTQASYTSGAVTIDAMLEAVPGIERCAYGAVKAWTGYCIANAEVPEERRVDLDTTISAMALTAKEMNSKYKETSEGGLAVSVVLC
jgi:hypothetical protein